jgi:hypothetical protein
LRWLDRAAPLQAVHLVVPVGHPGPFWSCVPGAYRSPIDETSDPFEASLRLLPAPPALATPATAASRTASTASIFASTGAADGGAFWRAPVTTIDSIAPCHAAGSSCGKNASRACESAKGTSNTTTIARPTERQ